MNFSCIEDVRKRIDEIDSQLVRIIAQRSECVKAAAAFKTDHAAVRAPDRVEQVINRVRKQANEAGLPETIIEKTYRAMIGAFIDYELGQHQQLQKTKSGPE
ncbi:MULTISPECIES: chorismate mutase [Klebsiella]|uniref:chorismate mutase n=1 Tax=Klebsiella TaxID=570 RepID=UPI00065171E2|nr:MULTISPECIES: chorismate mutase [Klebsiella]EFH7885453.1 chorismate mutase [Escherichia coli]EJK2315365.1 chorismate mutase [Klebsiella pneumoniae]EKQ9285100.1 chorismate mutase [Klebsiella pneumoniae]EKT0320935.1 chorismate mutase [Klebsiella pneumoniae]EKU7497361.1 chorismate mutase [Klebsiella pneumoniae]